MGFFFRNMHFCSDYLSDFLFAANHTQTPLQNVVFIHAELEDTLPDNPYERETYGRYRVLKLLGEGAMGRVYLSQDPILKRQVAVKVIAMDRHLDNATLKEYLERFSLEAQACAKLNHPSIVSIYDAGEEDGVPWIAFEYVDGERLDQLIKNEKRLSFEKASAIIRDIASAVSHAHSLEIVHRDVKPANILIDNKTGTAKLTDFGVVKSPCSAVTQDGSAVGSPGYMSPEQIDGTEVDSRSDIFSLGIVLYEMLSGVHPFLRETIPTTFYATLNCNYTPVRELRHNIPENFEQIVKKTLLPRKEERIQSAEKLCAMLGKKSERSGEQPKYITYFQYAQKAAKVVFKYSALFARKSFEILYPLIKKGVIIFARFCRDQVYPLLCVFMIRFYSFLRQRFSPRQIKTTAIAIPSGGAVIITLILVFTIRSRSNDYENLKIRAEENGFSVSHAKYLVDSCRAFILRDELEKAKKLAGILDSHKVSSVQARVFQGILAIQKSNYMEATELFSELKAHRSGVKAITQEHPFLLSFLQEKMETELPPPLVSLYAHQLGLAQNPKLEAWTEDKHYWVRWNAVRILQNAGKEVDLVPVYILDLTYSGSRRTKVSAVENLGVIGDRRAVPALIEHSENGHAARTASRVLKEKFGYEAD